MSAVFDYPNLIGTAGLVPVVGLCDRIGLRDLAGEWIRVDGLGRSNSGAQVMSLVAGMVAAADSIKNMDVWRHGGMDRVFTDWRAPATLGQFLRSFKFGHVRQFDALAARALVNLAGEVPGLVDTGAETVYLDIDDTIRAVYGVTKQGAAHGCTKVRGINAQLAAVSSPTCAPVITGARLRRGAVYSAHGAVRMIRARLDRHDPTDRVHRPDRGPRRFGLLQQCGRQGGHQAGATYSITVRQDSAVRRRITELPDDNCKRISYTQAIPDPETGELLSAAEVAEISYTAFTSKARNQQITARLIVRRVPELNKTKLQAAGQRGLLPVYRYHALITNSTSELVAAEKGPPRPREHRIGHRRSEGIGPGPPAMQVVHRQRSVAGRGHHRVAHHPRHRHPRSQRVHQGPTATIRARIISTPAWIASSRRRLTLHLPNRWPWATGWTNTWPAIMTT